MTQSEHIDHLERELRELLETIRQHLLPLDSTTLRQRPDNDPKRWCALECFEHLNRSSRDYLDALEHRIHRAKADQWIAKPDEPVKSTWLGREAIRWVTPGNQKRFRTSKRYNPIKMGAPDSAIKSFIINSERLLRILQQARSVDINRARVRFAIIPLLKYRMANLLEFMVLHGHRHTEQAMRAAGVRAV
jgi:DinB superfamily